MTLLSLSEVLSLSDGECLTKPKNELQFDAVAPLSYAASSHISFLANEKYVDEALKSKAGVILCSKKMSEQLKGKDNSLVIVCQEPYAAFAKVSQLFFKPQHPFSGVSEHAVIDKSAQVHPSATIFPFVFIGPGAVIGAQTVIYSGCFIGATSTIGENCILYPNVVVREGCSIANRCILNPGVVIGGDGFGFAPTEKENVKIPQIGGVEIHDDVEIGSNATIDRGAMSNTQIGRQTKIDNLVMIAHNVVVGEFCFIAAQTGIAGSVEVGDRVTMGGQVGIAGHVKIGSKVSLTAQTGVSKNIPPNQVWGGTPARPFKEYYSTLAFINRLIKQSEKKERN